MKKIISLDGISLIVIGLVGGLLSFLLYDFIWRFIIILIGLLLLFWGISYLLFTINARNYKQDNIIKPALKSASLIFIGINLIIPWTSWVVQFLVGLVVGLYLLSNCLIRIYKSENKVAQLKKDSLQIIISLLIIVLGIQDGGKYLAVAFFVFILVCGIISIIMDKKNNNNSTNTDNREISDIEYYVDDNQE